MKTEEELSRSCDSLNEKYRKEDWYVGCGHDTKDKIFLYVSKETSEQPSTWEGTDVIVKKTGKFKSSS